MPIATVTGNIKDITGQGFPGLQPRIVFTPSGPGVVGLSVFTTKPVVKTTSHAEGYFSVDLQSTENMRPVVYYQVSIDWLDSGGNFVSVDHIDWKLYVPAAGGLLSDLFQTPMNPHTFWVDEDPPLYPQTGQYWLNPTTGDLKKWTV